jgi:hypothetical protein
MIIRIRTNCLSGNCIPFDHLFVSLPRTSAFQNLSSDMVEDNFTSAKRVRMTIACEQCRFVGRPYESYIYGSSSFSTLHYPERKKVCSGLLTRLFDLDIEYSVAWCSQLNVALSVLHVRDALKGKVMITKII